MIQSKKYLLLLLSSAILLLVVGVIFSFNRPTNTNSEDKPTRKANTVDPAFKEYWYQGKAEISSYDLVQARYGELHKGTAVTVFVTEPFSQSKQVKLNNTTRNAEDVVPVLKLNTLRKFATGIYDYSIMQSVFTPVDIDQYEHSIKVSTSIQEWCGHTYMQLNLQPYKYKVLLHSYFETEADQTFQLDRAMLEDELLNLIRISPKSLPTGSIRLIPNTATTRLIHSNFDIEEAAATLTEHEREADWMTYTITFTNSQRKLSVHFQKAFPYQIEAWEESYLDGGRLLTTKATRKKTILSPYWSKNRLADRSLRRQLGLE